MTRRVCVALYRSESDLSIVPRSCVKSVIKNEAHAVVEAAGRPVCSDRVTGNFPEVINLIVSFAGVIDFVFLRESIMAYLLCVIYIINTGVLI